MKQKTQKMKMNMIQDSQFNSVQCIYDRFSNSTGSTEIIKPSISCIQCVDSKEKLNLCTEYLFI